MAKKRQRKPGIRSSSWIRAERRLAIYLRDNGVCVWCGYRPDQFTLDHLFPRASRHRDNHPRRLVTACVPCNSERQDMGVSRWLRQIRDRGFDIAQVLLRLARRSLALDMAAGKRHLRARRKMPLVPPEWKDDPYWSHIEYVEGVPF